MYENAVAKPLLFNALQRFYVLQHVFEHYARVGVSSFRGNLPLYNRNEL